MHRIGSPNIDLSENEHETSNVSTKRFFAQLNTASIMGQLSHIESSRSTEKLPVLQNNSADLKHISSTPTFLSNTGSWHVVHDEKKHANEVGISVGARFPGTRILQMFQASMKHANEAFSQDELSTEAKTPFDRDSSVFLESMAAELGLYQNIIHSDESSSMSKFSDREWRFLLLSMTRSLFEEKWLDISMGELSSELGRCSVEQQRLIDAIRFKTTAIINSLIDLVKFMLKKYDDASLEQDDLLSLNNHLQTLADSSQQLQDESVAKIKQALESGHSMEVENLQKDLNKSQRQVSNMTDALRTLSAMTKAMEADYECVSFADERNRAERAEKRLKELEVEVEYAKVAKREEMLLKAQLAAVKDDLAREKDKSARLLADNQSRDAILSDMIEREAKREAELAHIKLSVQESSLGEDTGDVSSQDASIKKLEEQLSQVPSAVLCVRCKKSLDDIANVAASLIGHSSDQISNPNLDFMNGYQRPEFVCQTYRSMLPNLGFDNRPGLMPARSLTWTRCCIRSIFMAKVMDNATIQNSHEKEFKPRRFPEFAFSYFYLNPIDRRVLDALGLPDPSAIDTAASKSSSAESLSWNKVRGQVQKRSDEDRWTFYYGMKSIAKEYSDAKLFYTLLDETYSEDYESFIMYCLSLVYRMEGKSLIYQFGPAFCCFDSLQLREKFGHDCLVGPIKDLSVAARYAGGNFDTTMSSFDAANVIWINRSKLEDLTKKIFSKASELELTGIFRTMDQVEAKANDASLIDMFSWIRLMGQFYLRDQTKRNAAIKLMFDTAWTGAMTTYKPPNNDGQTTSTEISTVDMLQFDAILRSINSELSSSQIAHLFIDSSHVGSGKVTASSFHHSAHASRFFTQCLKLPSFLTIPPDLIAQEVNDDDIIVGEVEEDQSAEDGDVSPELNDLKKLRSATSAIVDSTEKAHERHQLGALVHYHLALLAPQIENMCEILSESARTSIRLAVSEAHRSIEESRVGDMLIDGVRPFTAFRRLLMQCLMARIQYQESFSFQHILASPRSIQLARLEMEHMERILQAFRVDARMEAFLRVRRMVAVIRTQRAWRKRISISPLQAIDNSVQSKAVNSEQSVVPAIPISIRRLLKPGYVLGKDMTARRKIVHQPVWVMAAISNILHNVMTHDESKIDKQGLSFPEVVIDFFLSRFGSTDLAIRSMHDFFFNLAIVRGQNARADVFSAFLGIQFLNLDGRIMPVTSKRIRSGSVLMSRASIKVVSDSDLEGAVSQRAHMMMPHWQTEEAIRFYLASILAVHKHCSRDGRCYILGDVDGLFRASECFGATNKPDEWKERKEDLKAVAEFVWSDDILLASLDNSRAANSNESNLTLYHYMFDCLSELFPTDFGTQFIGKTITSIKEFLDDERQLETVRIVAAVDRLPTDDQECADVDDFLKLMMQHWSRMVLRTVGWIRNYVMTLFALPVQSDSAIKDLGLAQSIVTHGHPSVITSMVGCLNCCSYLPFWPSSGENSNATGAFGQKRALSEMLSTSLFSSTIAAFGRVNTDKSTHSISSANQFTAAVRKECEKNCPSCLSTWGHKKSMLVLSVSYDAALDQAFPRQQSPMSEKRLVMIDPSQAIQIMECLINTCVFYTSASLLNHSSLNAQVTATQESIVPMRRELSMIWSSYERPIRAFLQEVEIDSSVPPELLRLAEKTFSSVSLSVKASMELSDNQSSEVAQTRIRLQTSLSSVSHLFQLLECLSASSSKPQNLGKLLLDLPSANKALSQG